MAESQPVKSADRDLKTGQFLPGNNANPNGRPKKKTITEALRELVDPDEAARLLWRRAKKNDQVLMHVRDALDGKARQGIDMKADVTGEWRAFKDEVYGGNGDTPAT